MERLSGWSWRSAKNSGYEELPSQETNTSTDYTDENLVHNLLVRCRPSCLPNSDVH